MRIKLFEVGIMSTFSENCKYFLTVGKISRDWIFF